MARHDDVVGQVSGIWLKIFIFPSLQSFSQIKWACVIFYLSEHDWTEVHIGQADLEARIEALEAENTALREGASRNSLMLAESRKWAESNPLKMSMLAICLEAHSACLWGNNAACGAIFNLLEEDFVDPVLLRADSISPYQMTEKIFNLVSLTRTLNAVRFLAAFMEDGNRMELQEPDDTRGTDKAGTVSWGSKMLESYKVWFLSPVNDCLTLTHDSSFWLLREHNEWARISLKSSWGMSVRDFEKFCFIETVRETNSNDGDSIVLSRKTVSANLRWKRLLWGYKQEGSKPLTLNIQIDPDKTWNNLKSRCKVVSVCCIV